jgi:hypothetical protein
MKLKEEFAIGFLDNDHIYFVTENNFYSTDPDRAHVFPFKNGAIAKRKYLQEMTKMYKKDELKIISITTTIKPITNL